MGLLRALFDGMVRLLAARNLRSDRFGTFAAILGVALGTATVDVVVILDVNTVVVESGRWSTDPALDHRPDTIDLAGYHDGAPVSAQDEKQAANSSGSIRFITVRSQSAQGMP